MLSGGWTRLPDRPGATRILIRSVVGGAVAGFLVTAFRLLGEGTPPDYWLSPLMTPGPTLLVVVGGLVLAVLIVISFYWRRLIIPHRVNPLLFAAIAPWDIRLTAMFAMVASQGCCAAGIAALPPGKAPLACSSGAGRKTTITGSRSPANTT